MTQLRTENTTASTIRINLEDEREVTNQCLRICEDARSYIDSLSDQGSSLLEDEVANEVSPQKVYRIGEVIADDNSDQVVVTTLADLFEIKKALSKGHLAQLVGSITGDELRLLAEKRYGSRFGAVVENSDPAAASTTTQSSVSEVQKSQHDPPSQATYHEQSPGSKTRQTRPGANEMRKRLSGGIMD